MGELQFEVIESSLQDRQQEGGKLRWAEENEVGMIIEKGSFIILLIDFP